MQQTNLYKIAKDFENEVLTNLSSYVSQYINRFGKFIDTDQAREFCPQYAESNENRAQLAPLIHESASQIVKEVWRFLLNKSSTKEGLVIFLAGGPGSGKSTVVKFKKFRDYFDQAIVVYDSTFSNILSASNKIQDAINAGKDVDIYYVHRNAKDAAYSVVIRAVESGRTVPIEEVINLHWGAQKTIIELCNQYKNSESITIHLFDNRGSSKSFDWFDENEWQSVLYTDIVEVRRLVNTGAREAYARIREDKGSFPTAIALGIWGRENPF